MAIELPPTPKTDATKLVQRLIDAENREADLRIDHERLRKSNDRLLERIAWAKKQRNRWKADKAAIRYELEKSQSQVHELERQVKDLATDNRYLYRRQRELVQESTDAHRLDSERGPSTVAEAKEFHYGPVVCVDNGYGYND